MEIFANMAFLKGVTAAVKPPFPYDAHINSQDSYDNVNCKKGFLDK